MNPASMLNDLRELFQAAWQLQGDRFNGDVLLRRIDSQDGPTDPELEERLDGLCKDMPCIDLEELRQMPDGTLGREYARYMDEHGIDPITFSEDVKEVAERNVVAARYLVMHDLLHLLTGFPDNSYAGEIGLLAFCVEQGYGEEQEKALQIAEVLYPLLVPEAKEEIDATVEMGRRMGREADFVLAYRFEDNWEKPIEEVRKELGLPVFRRVTA